MKYASTLMLLVAMLTGKALAWEWQWVNPLPTGNNLVDVFFSDSTHGIAIAENGETIATADAGDTWKLRGPADGSVSAGTASTLDGVSLLAGGSDGIIWKSPDGGVSWRKVTQGTTTFFSLCQSGSGALAAGSEGSIFRSDDAGEHWGPVRVDTLGPYVLGLHCGDSGLAVAVGEQGLILRSLDSGRTWAKLTSPATGVLAGVHFADAAHGFVVGDSGLVMGTSDGGAHWDPRHLETTSFFKSIRRRGASITVSGTGGALWKSLDGGATWNKATSGSDDFLGATAFAGGATEIAVGNSGLIFKSGNAGKTWSPIRKGPDHELLAVSVLSPTNWFVFGADEEVMHTLDAGASWKIWSGTHRLALLGGDFRDEKTGLASGYFGTILRTENGGDDWTRMESGSTTIWLGGVAWFDSLTAVAVSDSGTILRSIDGGKKWAPVPGLPALPALYAVRRISGADGMAVGEEGTLLRTADGGASWTPISSQTKATLYAISFLDASDGMVVGSHGAVLVTHDAGRHWDPLFTEPDSDDFLYGVTMTGKDSAVVVGEWLHDPIAKKTADGGKTWTTMPNISASILFGVTALSPGRVLAAGELGSLLLGDWGRGPASARPPLRIPVAERIQARRLGSLPVALVTLALPQAGEAVITAYSGAGRRLASIFRGRVTGGLQSLTVPLGHDKGPLFLRLEFRGTVMKGPPLYGACRLTE